MQLTAGILRIETSRPPNQLEPKIGVLSESSKYHNSAGRPLPINKPRNLSVVEFFFVTVTSELARFAVDASYDEIPPDVRRMVKNALLDTVGCAIAGASTVSSKITSQWVKRNGGKAESTLFFDSWKGPASSVSFANTYCANALDFEPVGPESHVCAVTIPSALAVAEALDATGKDFLAALVMGIEVSGK